MSIYKLIENKKKEKKKKEQIKLAKIATVTAVVGASVGTAAGILFAPKSGKETRADIVDKSKLVKEDICSKSKSIKENLDTKMVKGKNNISEAKSKISEYLASKKKKDNNSEVIEEVETTEEVNDMIELEVVENEDLTV